MNNANIGYDCRNNFDARYFTTVINEIEEMSYIRKYHMDLTDFEISSLFSIDHLAIKINKDFDNRIGNLSTEDTYYDAKKTVYKTQSE